MGGSSNTGKSCNVSMALKEIVQVTFVVSTHLTLDCGRHKSFFHVPMGDELT